MNFRMLTLINVLGGGNLGLINNFAVKSLLTLNQKVMKIVDQSKEYIKKMDRKKALIICGAVLLVIILICFFACGKKKDKPADSTDSTSKVDGNTNIDGEVTDINVEGENSDETNSDGKFVSKMNLEGTTITGELANYLQIDGTEAKLTLTEGPLVEEWDDGFSQPRYYSFNDLLSVYIPVKVIKEFPKNQVYDIDGQISFPKTGFGYRQSFNSPQFGTQLKIMFTKEEMEEYGKLLQSPVGTKGILLLRSTNALTTPFGSESYANDSREENFEEVSELMKVIFENLTDDGTLTISSYGLDYDKEMANIQSSYASNDDDNDSDAAIEDTDYEEDDEPQAEEFTEYDY